MLSDMEVVFVEGHGHELLMGDILHITSLIDPIIIKSLHVDTKFEILGHQVSIKQSLDRSIVCTATLHKLRMVGIELTIVVRDVALHGDHDGRHVGKVPAESSFSSLAVDGGAIHDDLVHQGCKDVLFINTSCIRCCDSVGCTVGEESSSGFWLEGCQEALAALFIVLRHPRFGFGTGANHLSTFSSKSFQTDLAILFDQVDDIALVVGESKDALGTDGPTMNFGVIGETFSKDDCVLTCHIIGRVQ